MDSDLRMDDLSRARWEREAHPARHKPETALAAAAEYIAEHGADHVIVLISNEVDDGDGYRYMSAGKLRHLGQIGLLAAAQAMMLDG